MLSRRDAKGFRHSVDVQSGEGVALAGLLGLDKLSPAWLVVCRAAVHAAGDTCELLWRLTLAALAPWFAAVPVGLVLSWRWLASRRYLTHIHSWRFFRPVIGSIWRL